MKYFQSQPSLWRKTAIAAIALVTAGLLPLYQLASASTQKSQVMAPGPAKEAKVLPARQNAQKTKPTGKAKPSSAAAKATPAISVPGQIPPRPSASSQANPLAATAPARNPSSSPFAARATSIPRSENPAQAVELPARSANAPSPSDILPTSEARSAVPFSNTPPQATEAVEATAKPLPSVRPADPAGNPFGANSNPNVTFKFSNYDIRKAIEALFEQFHKSYVIEPGLSGEISASVEDVPFDEGLSAILKAVGGTYRIEGKIYTISLKH